MRWREQKEKGWERRKKGTGEMSIAKKKRWIRRTLRE